MSKKARIEMMLADGKTVPEIAARLNVKNNYVHSIRWLAKKKKKFGRPKKAKQEWVEVTYPAEAFTPDTILSPTDSVNHPPHYTAGGIETLDFIEAKDLNYRLGNVIKYISRAGKKVDGDPIQDLEKAAFYLNREIIIRKGA